MPAATEPRYRLMSASVPPTRREIHLAVDFGLDVTVVGGSGASV